jgi:dihydrofolate synthase / folylpolyglutamate synthase
MKGYSETLDYLYGLEKFGIVFGLDGVERILSLIDNPHESLRTIHVAGTNGKGSVASMVAEMARRAGYSVGLYTSPHLISFTERITVNGKPVSEKEVVELTQFIRERIEENDAGLRFTFFDFTTALAFEYLGRQKVDLAVIEVGLGGRLDSTNVLLPLVSVITNVALDHQDYLGNSLEAIAREKAGIIKKGIPVVTGARDMALNIIRDVADKKDLYALGEAFNYVKKSDQWMSYSGIGTSIDDLSVALRGDHQLFNAALAVCVTELLNQRGFTIGENAVRNGLRTVRWPGRLEVIPGGTGRPSIVLDGAHNPDGAKSLAAFLQSHFQGGKRILVFGVMKDKNFPEMLSTLAPVIDRVVLARPAIDRAADPVEVAAYVPGAIVTGSVEDAVKEAMKTAQAEDTVIVAGSFYTIGEAKKLLNEET